jgi:cytochrome b involved in lipid metabolism
MIYLQTIVYVLFLATTISSKPAPVPAAAGKTFTMADVKAQKLTVLSGNVYDLSKYAGSHPGGAGRIQNMMGGDGTAALKKKHGLGFVNQVKGSMVGTLATTSAAGAGNAAADGADPAPAPDAAPANKELKAKKKKKAKK